MTVEPSSEMRGVREEIAEDSAAIDNVTEDVLVLWLVGSPIGRKPFVMVN